MNKSSNKCCILLICLVLTLATIVAFEPVRHNEFVDLDDRAYVTENPYVNDGLSYESVIWAFTTSHSANWHPLTWLSHMLDCHLFDLIPFWHHLISLLLHIANALLLFCLLKKMTGSVWPSAFIAAVFALHPLRVESVAWVAERKDLLSGFFWMLTILFYLRYAQRPAIGNFLLAFFTFCLGLMAKPMLVTLPFVLLLLDYWPLDRFKSQHDIAEKDLTQSNTEKIVCRKSSLLYLIIEKIPLFILAAVSCVITFIAQQAAGAMEYENLPFTLRLSNAVVSYAAYIGKIFYPANLAPFYPLNILPIWQLIVSSIVLVAISLYVMYASKRRYLTTGWLWYLGTLLPVIGLVQVGLQAMADRYTYLPSIGIFIMIAWTVPELAAKLHFRKIVLQVSAGLILAALLVCTRIQVSYWRNTFTLYGHALDVTKNNFVMHRHYGNALARRDFYDEALAQLNQAVRINPQCYAARNDIGQVLLKKGNLYKAFTCFNDILKLKPDYPDAHLSLGMAMAMQAEYNNAISHFKNALKIKPDFFDAYYYLGLAYARLDKYDLAVQNLNRALQLRPKYPNTMNNLAWILATAEDKNLQNPNDAVNLAQQACRLTKYRQPYLMDTLAVAYAAEGRFSQAIETAEKAINLADAAGQKDKAQEIRNRLKFYQQGQPYIGPLPKRLQQVDERRNVK